MADADKLVSGLAEHVTHEERRPERVRDELLADCRAERIEPPAAGRIDRIVRSGLHVGEERIVMRVGSRLS